MRVLRHARLRRLLQRRTRVRHTLLRCALLGRTLQGTLVDRALLHGAGEGARTVVQVVTDAEGIHLYGSALRAVFAVQRLMRWRPLTTSGCPFSMEAAMFCARRR